MAIPQSSSTSDPNTHASILSISCTASLKLSDRPAFLNGRCHPDPLRLPFETLEAAGQEDLHRDAQA